MGVVVAGAVLSAIFTGVALASSRRTCTTRITPEIVRLAKKWARVRGIPVEWILATISLESGGKSCLVGDQGRSLGLMQVNTVAHAGLIKEMSLTKSSMYLPNTNIAVGSHILRERWELVHAATGGVSPVPMGTLVALAYWGPGPTIGAIRAGTDPRHQNPRRVERWDAALKETSPLV